MYKYYTDFLVTSIYINNLILEKILIMNIESSLCIFKHEEECIIYIC